jgi:hypothetical protein
VVVRWGLSFASIISTFFAVNQNGKSPSSYLFDSTGYFVPSLVHNPRDTMDLDDVCRNRFHIKNNYGNGLFLTKCVWCLSATDRFIMTNYSTVSTTGTLAVRAEGFIDSIGVNAHLGWWDTAWGAGNGQWAGAETKVAAELAYLDVSLVRDSVPYSSAVAAEYGLLAQAGIRFDMIQTTGGPVQLTSDIAEMAAFEAAYPGAIFAYEGANEYNANSYTLNGQNSLNNPAWGVLDAQVSSAAVAANAQLTAAGVKFIAPSTASVSSAPNMSPYVAASNWHVYAGPGQQLQNNIIAGVADARSSAPGVPVILTEVGVSSAAISSSTWGVAGTDALQGLIDLNAVLDAYKAGAQETFLYELMDNNAATDQEDNFGLFNADGTPKAAAVYIHDLISILQDNGASAATFLPGSLNYVITNLPTTASSMLLEKSSGAYDIALWNGNATVFNSTTGTAVTPAASNVTVQLGGTYQTVQIFDPVLGSTAIQILHNVSAVTLSLAADPLIVEVEPNPTSASYVPGAAGGTINSTGNDTILVGPGAVKVNASGPSVHITGGAGALTYSGTAVATIAGAAGAMNITLGGSGSSVMGGNGGMTVLDTVGGNTITGGPGGANNGITVTTTKGNDVITTGAWTATNQINLGAGRDTVVANGTSTIVGTTGNDQITVNGWWGDVTTGTGSSQVTLNTYGIVRTHGTDVVKTTSGLTLVADGPSTTLTAGMGFVWLSGTGAMHLTGGIGGGYFDMTQSPGGSIQTAAGATDTILLGADATSATTSGHDTVRLGGGSATISALAGSDAVAGGTGKMTFIEGASTSSVAIGSGASTFDFINGSAGGSLTISGFRLGTDTLHLQGYAGSGIGNEQVVGGALQIALTDNTHVTLTGITSTASSIFA